ncbi:cupin domain-containing protein [Archangium lansingense]|uniref:Cupin domain-containing protein n=1 Tax=Archangium lansingense TaxID=2995310 RepID=A0ABT4ABX3_9BACT|nr:cupin domain-containing protein [Archangium lansinium]MCY1079120.1 cupin domain-containing protein [Archangium lansinium]
MARRVCHYRWPGLGFIALACLVSACTGEPVANDGPGSKPDSMEQATAMIVYSPRGGPVDESGLIPLGPPEELGGRVLEGDPQIFARIDYSANGVTAGLFKATTGTLEVTFPFTEHATILEGQVTITDSTGQSHLFKAGDSYFIRQGQVIVWEVKGKQVIKSFFNTVEPQ